MFTNTGSERSCTLFGNVATTDAICESVIIRSVVDGEIAVVVGAAVVGAADVDTAVVGAAVVDDGAVVVVWRSVVDVVIVVVVADTGRTAVVVV